MPLTDKRLQAEINKREKTTNVYWLRVLAAYQRSRREMYLELTAFPDNPITTALKALAIQQVDTILSNLYRDVTSLFGVQVGQTVKQEADEAIKNIQAVIPKERLEELANNGGAAEITKILHPSIPTKMVEAIAEDNAKLVKSVNDTLRNDIGRELTRGMIEGKSVPNIAKQILDTGITMDGIRPVFKNIEARAETIARTELKRAANVTHLENYKQLLVQFPGTKIEWVAKNCSKKCDYCQKVLNGMLVVPGANFVAPGFVGTHPPAHPRCRCTIVPVVGD